MDRKGRRYFLETVQLAVKGRRGNELGDVIWFKKPRDYGDFVNTFIEKCGAQDASELPVQKVSPGEVPVVNDPGEKAHCNVPDTFLSGAQKGDTRSGNKAPSVKDKVPNHQGKNEQRKPLFKATYKQDKGNKNKADEGHKYALGPAKRRQPEALIPKRVIRRIEESSSAFVTKVVVCLIEAVIVFTFFVLFHFAVPSFFKNEMFSIIEYTMIWYASVSLFQLVFGLFCRFIGVWVGKKVRLWTARQTANRRYESWEWGLTAYGEKWWATAFVMTCLAPGFTAALLSSWTVPVPLWFSGAVLVVGTVTLIFKRWNDTWEEIVIPLWSVTWQLDRKIKKRGVS